MIVANNRFGLVCSFTSEVTIRAKNIDTGVAGYFKARLSPDSGDSGVNHMCAVYPNTQWCPCFSLCLEGDSPKTGPPHFSMAT